VPGTSEAAGGGRLPSGWSFSLSAVELPLVKMGSLCDHHEIGLRKTEGPFSTTTVQPDATSTMLLELGINGKRWHVLGGLLPVHRREARTMVALVKGTGLLITGGLRWNNNNSNGGGTRTNKKSDKGKPSLKSDRGKNVGEQNNEIESKQDSESQGSRIQGS
jgi:hypothetical protein